MVHWFAKELHRRRVLRVTAAYTVIAFLVLNTLAGASEYFGWPSSWVTGSIVVGCALFPIVAITAWYFDYTPWGIFRTPPEGELPKQPTGLIDRRVEAAIILVLLIALGYSLGSLFRHYVEVDASPPPGIEQLKRLPIGDR